MISDQPYERLDVSDWEVISFETAGAEEKIWVQDGRDRRALFKPVVVKNGFRHGEDWAEKIAAGLAALIRVPCAEVDLAYFQGREGALSWDLRPRAYALHPGDAFLVDKQAPRFKSARDLTGPEKGLRPGHSLVNIRQALVGVGPPPGSLLPEGFDGFDTFVGYVVLDAWIANRDRHDENWSVLVPEIGDGSYLLAGAYDQAGSLGYNLTPAKLDIRFGDPRGVRTFAEKGTAWRFENGGRGRVPTLVELAIDAIELASAEARSYWIECIAGLAQVDVGSVVGRASGMSEAARTFAVRLLVTNAERLHHEYNNRR